MTQRVAVYVDGFNLYFGMHEKFGRRYLWLDLRALAESFLQGDQRLVKVVYFTARVRNNPSAQANQGAYLAALKAHGGLDIVEGRFQHKRRTCLKCKHGYDAYEEKETDVSLATALIEDAVNGVYDRAILVTADSDLGPAVRAVRRLRPEVGLVAAFPPARRSGDLKKQLHGVFAIGRDKLRDAQLPAEVLDVASGRKYARPSHWL